MSAEIRVEVRTRTCGLLQGCDILLVGEEPDAVAFEKWRFERKGAGPFVLLRKLASFDFASFDVRLIESVDTDHGARDCGGNLPAEKFLADVVDFGHVDAENGLTVFFESANRSVLLCVRSRGETQIRKHAVVTKDLRRADIFAIHGNQATALLARGFGE